MKLTPTDMATDTASIEMTEGGIRIKTRGIKLDQEGSVNLQTGERIISIMPNELEDGPILGQGNGGLVRVVIHR
jgi:hypothetical protein